MTPSKPSRTNYMTTSTSSSYDTPQPTYEDPDASLPALTDGSQSEVKVKPVPRPRFKLKPNAQCNNNNKTVDSVDESSNAVSSQNNGFPADYKRPRPVRPPPKPPMSKFMTSSRPRAAVSGSNLYYTSSNTEPTVTPPAVSEKIQLPPAPRPQRPPPPSTYYDRPAILVKSKSYTEESQQSRHSSISSVQQTPVSPALSEETGYLFGTYNAMPTDTDRPAVPSRPAQLRQSSLPCSVSVCEMLPTQTRPPPPPFNPPPPPSRTPSESVYNEIEYPSYLDLLPEEDDEMEMNSMLRWLKRVSRSDYMAPSLYGLSIEEEIRSFNQRAMNVKQALRLYSLLMMKRNEILRDHISEFTSISDSLDKVQKTNKTMGIAGGTTGAVGGVTAVVGIALAPMTMGASLIATAVGAGMVASAGGMGAHAAKANKKIVNRTTVEKLVSDYTENIVEMEQCLDLILSGMNELRRHDIARLQRSGAQLDAVRMAHLSQSVLRSNMNKGGRTSVARTAGMSSERLLQAFAKEMDQYFKVKDGQKLKESTKSMFSGRVRLLAQNLQDELDHLNRMWEMFC